MRRIYLHCYIFKLADILICRGSLFHRDKRLLKELVSGVIRWRRRLDYTIAELSQKDDLEPMLVQILRLGFYELMFRAIQPHVLNEHVQLSKVLVRPEAGAFTNGMLRAATRAMVDGTLPDPEVPGGKLPFAAEP